MVAFEAQEKHYYSDFEILSCFVMKGLLLRPCLPGG